MAFIVVLAALALLFYLVRKHTGPAHLAVIAGVSVNNTFGLQFSEFLHNNVFTTIELDFIVNCVSILLILAFPMLLYLKSSRGGLFGILRIVEAAIFAAIVASLIAGPLAYFFSFDNLSTEIYSFIKSIEGPIILVGVISAYVDILTYRDRYY